MQRLVLTLIYLLWIAACSMGSQPELEVLERLPTPQPTTAVSTTVVPATLPVPVKIDPYAGWEKRCEPEISLCRTDRDCNDVYHPSGKPLHCVQPYWSKPNDDGVWTKVCSPGWSNRIERQWRKDRLRTFVSLAYFDESAQCEQERPLAEQPWACQREARKAETLTRFLWTVYARETTGRPWKRHRLNGDLRANRSTWKHKARRYGHHVHYEKYYVRENGKLVQRDRAAGIDFSRTGNRHYRQRWRWQYGLGPYGQNAALWVASWDPMAPPEILCGEVESTESYLRGARRVWRKLRGGISCGGEKYQPTITWEILHRGVAGGKLCPARTPSEGFRRRSRRWGLDPDQVVTLAMLGDPIDRETQREKALEYAAFLDVVLPGPKMSNLMPRWQRN